MSGRGRRRGGRRAGGSKQARRRRARPAHRGWRARALRAGLWLAAAAVLISSGTVLALRWVDPPTTAFMLRASREPPPPGTGSRLRHARVPLESISMPMRVAVIAAEDQRFLEHAGFDLGAVGDALDDFARGGRLRGASTISQQLAKNLFLWRGRSMLRKGLEAYFTVLLELLVPKRRILELYLNVVEFGPRTFGVEAAAITSFGRPASALTREQAALLAGVLPAPARLRVTHPSAYLRERAGWIRDQAARLERQLDLRALR